MSWYERIVAAHTAVTDVVSHGGRMKSERYFVWQEDGAGDLMADGIHAERLITGSTDLFTKQEFDPWREQFEEALEADGTIAWYLNSIQFEPDTKYWHYEWRWEL